MSKASDNTPWPVQPPPALLDEELAPLLAPSLGHAWQLPVPAGADALRARLQARAAASRAAESALHTTRGRRVPWQAAAAGISTQALYLLRPGTTPRPGEPLRARLVRLAPGARLDAAALGGETELQPRHREWLVMQGEVQGAVQGNPAAASPALGLYDYHVTPAGQPTPAWHTQDGALLFLREAALAAQAGDAPQTLRDAEAGWPDFGPGVQRRVLWQRDGQAAMLYRTRPGATVPHHGHGHDEECLMVQGDIFLDDVLLQAGDYQLAPAGTDHLLTQTDTGVLLYVHGDLDMQFVG